MNIDEPRVIYDLLSMIDFDMQIKHVCITDVRYCTYKYQRSAK